MRLTDNAERAITFVICLFIILGAGLVMNSLIERNRVVGAASGAVAASLDRYVDKPTPRALYPLSVIPGGVATVSEFNARASQDPALKSLVCPEATASIAPADITVFTTFRRGNTIKWNRKPIVVKKGERLIVGCGRTLLARCANQVLFTPQTPSEELPPGTLETPVTENIAPPEVVAPPVTVQSSEITTSEVSTPPVVVIGGGFPGGPGGGGIGGGTTPPPIRTPEPGTWVMIVAGSFLAIFVYLLGDVRSHFPWR